MSNAAQALAEMDTTEREVFVILAGAAEARNDALCDPVVCLHFVRKGLMRIQDDGFVISDLGIEVIAAIDDDTKHVSDGED